MWRNVGAVVLGYVVMFVIVFVTFSVAYAMMGTSGAFEEGSYEVTVLWLIVGFAVSVIAALAGGFVCAVVARGSRAPLALAGFVLVVGLLMAVGVATEPDDGPPVTRDADVSMFDAMQESKQPLWVALANPFVGVIGVLLGSRLRAGRKRPDPTE